MTANVPVTFVFCRFVVPVTSNELLIVVEPFSVVAPSTFNVSPRFVAPVAVNVFNVVAPVAVKFVSVVSPVTPSVPPIV